MEQLSIFDLLGAAPEKGASAPLDPTECRRYFIQASFQRDFRSFSILGKTCAVTVPEDLPKNPGLLFEMNLTGYYLQNELIPRGQMLDVYFRPIDDTGEWLATDRAAIRIRIKADDLYAAYSQRNT